jgi:hypothetical protein
MIISGPAVSITRMFIDVRNSRCFVVTTASFVAKKISKKNTPASILTGAVVNLGFRFL